MYFIAVVHSSLLFIKAKLFESNSTILLFEYYMYNANGSSPSRYHDKILRILFYAEPFSKAFDVFYITSNYVFNFYISLEISNQ